jgi:hypothetical protein
LAVAGYGETMTAYTERALADWRDGQVIDLHVEIGMSRPARRERASRNSPGCG